MSNEAEEGSRGMSNEEKAFLIKALWKALCEPAWTKSILIDLGVSVHGKVTLKDMDDATYEKLFPFLEEVAESLGEQLKTEADRVVNEMTKRDDKPNEKPAEKKVETKVETKVEAKDEKSTEKKDEKPAEKKDEKQDEK
jgi:hypothetical protein